LLLEKNFWLEEKFFKPKNILTSGSRVATQKKIFGLKKKF
jgi:hypothetical protein